MLGVDDSATVGDRLVDVSSEVEHVAPTLPVAAAPSVIEVVVLANTSVVPVSTLAVDKTHAVVSASDLIVADTSSVVDEDVVVPELKVATGSGEVVLDSVLTLVSTVVLGTSAVVLVVVVVVAAAVVVVELVAV